MLETKAGMVVPPIILILGGLRQEHYEFEPSLTLKSKVRKQLSCRVLGWCVQWSVPRTT